MLGDLVMKHVGRWYAWIVIPNVRQKVFSYAVIQGWLICLYIYRFFDVSDQVQVLPSMPKLSMVVE